MLSSGIAISNAAPIDQEHADDTAFFCALTGHLESELETKAVLFGLHLPELRLSFRSVGWTSHTQPLRKSFFS